MFTCRVSAERDSSIVDTLERTLITQRVIHKTATSMPFLCVTALNHGDYRNICTSNNTKELYTVSSQS